MVEPESQFGAVMSICSPKLFVARLPSLCLLYTDLRIRFREFCMLVRGHHQRNAHTAALWLVPLLFFPSSHPRSAQKLILVDQNNLLKRLKAGKPRQEWKLCSDEWRKMLRDYLQTEEPPIQKSQQVQN